MAKISGRLPKEEVRTRLKLCEDPEVVNEVYTFGQMLLREALQNLHSMDSKAVWMAGYGAAIITLLVSSVTAWSTLGNKWTVGLAILAGVSSFVGAFFAVRSLALQSLDWIGDDEWLEKDCLPLVWKLKRYRIFTMWGAIKSADDINLSKALALRKAQWGLSVSVAILLLMLLQLGWIRVLRSIFWARVTMNIQHHPLWVSGWQNLIGSAGLGRGYLTLCSLSCGHSVGTADLIMRGLIFFSHGHIIFGSPH